MTPLDRDSAFLLALGASIAVHALGAGAAAAFRQERAERPGVVREESVELEWLTYEPVREPEFVEGSPLFGQGVPERGTDASVIPFRFRWRVFRKDPYPALLSAQDYR